MIYFNNSKIIPFQSFLLFLVGIQEDNVAGNIQVDHVEFVDNLSSHVYRAHTTDLSRYAVYEFALAITYVSDSRIIEKHE